MLVTEPGKLVDPAGALFSDSDYLTLPALTTVSSGRYNLVRPFELRRLGG